MGNNKSKKSAKNTSIESLPVTPPPTPPLKHKAAVPFLTPVDHESLLEQLECPICLDLCNKPIYRCENMHNYCSDCISRLKHHWNMHEKCLRQCPVCLIDFPENIKRNRTLECLATDLHQECKNYGVPASFVICPSLGLQNCTEPLSLYNLQWHMSRRHANELTYFDGFTSFKNLICRNIIIGDDTKTTWTPALVTPFKGDLPVAILFETDFSKKYSGQITCVHSTYNLHNVQQSTPFFVEICSKIICSSTRRILKRLSWKGKTTCVENQDPSSCFKIRFGSKFPKMCFSSKVTVDLAFQVKFSKLNIENLSS